ncbi:hypothetical protein BKA66DRAFT_439050 [Pyrenochaeta sp. MPI-SDFR-AT-0127]|nr:hypothetical protein BKA66DRAFT_439050 [Pyrenochaeta sp. MPI-SDFR-AT-0127]
MHAFSIWTRSEQYGTSALYAQIWKEKGKRPKHLEPTPRTIDGSSDFHEQCQSLQNDPSIWPVPILSMEANLDAVMQRFLLLDREVLASTQRWNWLASAFQIPEDFYTDSSIEKTGGDASPSSRACQIDPNPKKSGSWTNATDLTHRCFRPSGPAL